ncbi:hypothetical protein Poli38472_012045 [Pythium oligandrum]|uniref:TFIIS N-terminal domain-containing protein n=1 Tax=Pythium oligandrum TaxID=41045 RepID=A0A8K1FN43_PYTOL|nr:hypothetical protein Poli38472_012045 [Pythium oligandrum]|eukprot:TMW66929.1 hypothetical protein Poli38472_012045 [Pythium oligandrum]
MVRIRNPYASQAPPPASPALKTQRYAVGVRVANPLEGRMGSIASFDAEKGVYHLVFHDGHEEDVPEDQVDALVIRQPQPSAEKTAASEGFTMVGRNTKKVVTNYEGKELVLMGWVAAYFPDTKRCRIVYESGTCEDMPVEDTKKCIKAAEANSNGKRRASDEGDEDATRKKAKALDDELQKPPLNAQKFPSRPAAYTILRKVLRAILAQEMAKKHRTEKQLSVLKNEDIKPKRALEMFVEADGLSLLQKLLTEWMRSTETHPGASLVLKLLAALPGVTPDAVLASQIGKTLSGIVRVSKEMDHVDKMLGDLASWVIATWRRNVVPKGVSNLMATQHAVERAKGVLPALVVLPIASQARLKERHEMTKHLRELMTAPEPPPKETEPALFFPEYNSLGSIDKRRPARQIIHIESFLERVSNRLNDKTDEEEKDDGIPKGRMQFRKPDVHQFNPNVPPANLFATARSRALDAQHQRLILDEDEIDAVERGAKMLPPPNRTQAPKKSILKATEEVIVPAKDVIWA